MEPKPGDLPPKKEENKEAINMDAFREEIAPFVKKYEKKPRLYTIHLEDLTGEDAEMWHRIEDKSATRDDFNIYSTNVRNSRSSSRMSFRALLSERIFPLLEEKENWNNQNGSTQK